MDYYKLGETTGKAWRLGHLDSTREGIDQASRYAATSLQVPASEKERESNSTGDLMQESQP